MVSSQTLAAPAHRYVLAFSCLGCGNVHRCAEGKPIPTELRKDEADLRREIDLEDDNTAVPRT
jgi:hypothetical protein